MMMDMICRVKNKMAVNHKGYKVYSVNTKQRFETKEAPSERERVSLLGRLAMAAPLPS